MKHSQEPWYLEPHSTIDKEFNLSGDGGAIASIYYDDVDHEEQDANAQRIVDCVNALAGVENPKEFCDNRSRIINKLIEEKRGVEVVNVDQSERIKALEGALKFSITELSAAYSVTEWANEKLKEGADKNIERLKNLLTQQ